MSNEVSAQSEQRPINTGRTEWCGARLHPAETEEEIEQRTQTATPIRMKQAATSCLVDKCRLVLVVMFRQASLEKKD